MMFDTSEKTYGKNMENVTIIKSIDDLLTIIKENHNIIIYGYKQIGECLLDFLMNNYYGFRPSYFLNEIRCFATSYDTYEVRIGQKEIKGIPIFPIYELTDYAESDLVIVATREKLHDAILETLKEYGFSNIALVSKELYTYLRLENQQISGELRLEVMNYSLCHQHKLNCLRDKVASGQKVNVLFMTQRSSMFGCKSIYHIMEKTELFNPHILVFSKRDKLYENWQQEVEEDILYFEEKGYKVLSAYDEYGYLVDLDTYEPDILFFDCPNLHATAGMSHLRNDILNWKYLTCYVPYGCLMADSFYYHFENINIRQAWRYFVDTKYSYKKSVSGTSFNANNPVLAGYPKMDDYFDERESYNIPDKINNGKKIVIYAPHWTIRCNNDWSTFHKYYNFFLSLAKNNPEINFVFKPHPQLEHRIKLMEDAGVQGMITSSEYKNYIKEWNALPNGLYFNEGDYIDLFRSSSCLVTDCGSFIGEYLPSGHPCIYLLNTEKEKPMKGYTEVAQDILNTYYLCENVEEIEKAVQEYIIGEKDPKMSERKQILEREFVNIGKSGQFIVDYLEQYLC